MTAGEPPEPVPVEFDGRVGERFGIWIVNLALTVVTLGIYSAWAKVRRKKCFYRHTRIAGRSFDYRATGQQILIGRAIVLAGLIASPWPPGRRRMPCSAGARAVIAETRP